MPDPALSLPCILLVDDDADQLVLCRRMLEKAAVKNPLVELAGGPEAIAYLSGCLEQAGSAGAALPALIFLDLHMPKVDGLGVLQWVRNKPGLEGLKVVVLSSSDDADDVKRCIELGARGYLVKHPHHTVVACVLREALGESSSPFPSATTCTA